MTIAVTGALFVPLLALAAPVRTYDGPEAIEGGPEPVVEAPHVVVTPPPRVREPEDPQAEPPPRADLRLPIYTTPPPLVDEPARNWKVGGFVDTGYTFDHNFPDNHVDRGNFTAVRANEITVNLAALYVRHTPTDAEPWVFELAAQLGTAAAELVAGEPRPGGDASDFTGAEVWQHLGRANVGVRLPKVGTELAVGLFPTPVAFGSFWSKDNWTYSTPWQLNAVPYVLMGGRITQPIGNKFVAQLWVHNGYQTYGDVNRVPSMMVGGTYAPRRHLVLSHWTYFGAEEVDNRPRAWRTLFDTYVVYDTGKLGIAAAFDVGRERLTAIVFEPVALWVNGTLTTRGRILTSPRGRVAWDMFARAEAFWDRDGRMYGVRQLVGSGAYGNTITLFDHVMLRVEYRYDRSSNPAGYFYKGAAVHDDDIGLGRDQHSLFFALTGYFEHAFATRRAKQH